MKLLKGLEKKIVKFEEWFLVFLLFLMILLAFAQVILRNFFSSGIIWSDVLVRMGVLYIAIIGGSIATSDRAHIKIDLFSRVMSDKYNRYIDMIIKIVAVYCCVFFFIRFNSVSTGNEERR